MKHKFEISDKLEVEGETLKITEINQNQKEPSYIVTGEYNHWLGEDGFLTPLTYELTESEMEDVRI